MTDHNDEIDQLGDRLDALLPPGSERISQHIPDGDVLVQLAARLASGSHPQPSFEAMARMQAQMLAAQHALTNASTTSSGGGGRILTLARRTLAAVASVVLVLFFASPLVAQSVPGDFLYPAKITYERVELGLAAVIGDPTAVHLSHAKSRAAEAVKLAQEDAFRSDLIESAAEAIEQAAHSVRSSQAAPVPEYAGKLAEIDALIEFAIAEATRNPLTQAEVARASAAINRVRLGGEYQALGGTLDDDRSLVETPLPGIGVPQPEATAEATPAIVEGTEEAPIIIEVPTTASPNPIIATIIGDGKVNLRQGPGLDNGVLLQLNPGALVQIIRISDDEDWLQVRLPDGTEGWVAQFLVAVGQVPTTAGASGTTPGTTSAGTAPNGSADPTGDNAAEFGCEQPGNACNAPGTQNNNPDENANRGRS